MTQLEATEKVRRIRANITDEKLAEIIGITRKTLYSRIKTVKNWKKAELLLIKLLKEDEYIR